MKSAPHGSSLSLQAQLVWMNVAVTIPTLLLFIFYVFPVFEENHLKNRTKEGRNAVDIAVSTFESLDRQVEAHQLDLAAA